MTLQLLWFILVIFFFTVLFILEGFDYGIGMLYPWIGRNDAEKRILLNTIGPFWLGNEVWMVCGIGTLFAAFPTWYATLFGSLYPILLSILGLLAVRGAAIEFRNHGTSQAWRHCWDGIIAGSSLLVSMCWGITIANVIGGLPLDQQAHFVGNVFGLLNLYAFLWGCALSVFFLLYGAIFLLLRVEKQHRIGLHSVALRLWIFVMILLLLLSIASFIFAPITFHSIGAFVGLLLLVAMFLSGRLLRSSSYWLSFLGCVVAIVLAAFLLGEGMYPHILISNINPAWSLTLAQTASAPYTLEVISWCILPLLPFLIFAQVANYWIFRRRLHDRSFLYY